MRPKPLHSKRRRAVILILSLWIAMILSIMAFSVAYEVRINLRLAHQGQGILKARGLARAGIAKAVMDLRNDKLLAIADPTNQLTDSYKDVWAQTDDKTEVKLGEGVYTVRVEDEEGKLNLNFLNPQTAPILGYIIAKVCDIDPIKANVMASMVLDYQDPDPAPSAGQGDTETEYYTDWAHRNFKDEIPEDWTFKPKNDVIMDLEELLAIPGITRTRLFGDPDKVDPREPRRIRRTEEESNILADYVTVLGGRLINVNTVSQITLQGLFRVALPNIFVADDLARKVCDYRIQLAKTEGTRGTILNIMQLQEAGVPRQELSKINGIIPLQVASSFFTITSRGEYKGVSRTIEARVNVALESFRIDGKNPDTFGRRDRRASGSLRHRMDNVIDPSVRVVEIKEL